MTDYKVIVGDWSDDGHGKADSYIVDVSAEFSVDVLRANYEKNVSEIGFAPTSLCEDYEDSSVSEEQANALFAAGLPDDRKCIATEPGPYPQYFVPDSEGMLHLCMFFLTRNLTGATWFIKNDSIPTLFGGANPVIDAGSVGYGLYY